MIHYPEDPERMAADNGMSQADFERQTALTFALAASANIGIRENWRRAADVCLANLRQDGFDVVRIVADTELFLSDGEKVDTSNDMISGRDDSPFFSTTEADAAGATGPNRNDEAKRDLP